MNETLPRTLYFLASNNLFFRVRRDDTGAAVPVSQDRQGRGLGEGLELDLSDLSYMGAVEETFVLEARKAAEAAGLVLVSEGAYQLANSSMKAAGDRSVSSAGSRAHTVIITGNNNRVG